MTVSIDGAGSISGLVPIVVRATKTGPDSNILSNTQTVVVFNTEEEDSSGAYNNSTGVFTAVVPGTYQVNWRVSLSSTTAVGASALSILRKNGTDYRRGSQLTSTGINVFGSAGSASVSLLSGDTLDITGLITFGSGLGEVDSGSAVTFLDIHLVQRT